MKQLSMAFRCFILLTVITGFIYPAAVTVISRLLFIDQANGSLIKNIDGKVIGSRLIAQAFKNDRYFWPRPSAVDFNPLPSGGSNLGPTSKTLKEKWDERRKAGLTGDLLGTSASGLDPHISPESTAVQIARVAKSRGLNEFDVKKLVESLVESRQWGFLGESRVNVLLLNLAMDEHFR